MFNESTMTALWWLMIFLGGGCVGVKIGSWVSDEDDRRWRRLRHEMNRLQLEKDLLQRRSMALEERIAVLQKSEGHTGDGDFWKDGEDNPLGNCSY